jgi:MFS family permease
MASVILLMILTHTAYGATRLSLSLTAIKWQLPTFAIGLLLSLISFIPMLVSVWVGRWLDKGGTYKPLLIGCAALLVGTLLPRLWPSSAALFISSAMMGTGFLLCHMCGQQITGLTSDGQLRAKYFGWLAVGFSVSGFFGPMLAGFVIDYLGHLNAFLMAAGLSAMALFAAHSLKDALNRQPEATKPLIEPGLTTKADKASLLKDRRLVRLFICVMLISSAWDVHQFLVPIHASSLGLSASEIGLIMGAFAVATLLIRMLLPTFTGRLSHWKVIAGVLFIAAFSYAVYPLLPGASAMMLVSFLLGLGLGCGQPIVMASLYELAPKGRAGEAAGLRQSLINATQTALPILFGSAGSMLAALAAITGVVIVTSLFAPLFWLFSAAALVGGISTWRYSNRVS